MIRNLLQLQTCLRLKKKVTNNHHPLQAEVHQQINYNKQSASMHHACTLTRFFCSSALLKKNWKRFKVWAGVPLFNCILNLNEFQFILDGYPLAGYSRSNTEVRQLDKSFFSYFIIAWNDTAPYQSHRSNSTFLNYLESNVRQFKHRGSFWETGESFAHHRLARLTWINSGTGI